MIDFNEYISPSLLILIPVLNLIGNALKAAGIKHFKVPFLLGGIGIALACIWLLAADFPTDMKSALMTLLSGIVQGILCAAVSVYGHNLYKQYANRSEDIDTGKDNDDDSQN